MPGRKTKPNNLIANQLRDLVQEAGFFGDASSEGGGCPDPSPSKTDGGFHPRTPGASPEANEKFNAARSAAIKNTFGHILSQPKFFTAPKNAQAFEQIKLHKMLFPHWRRVMMKNVRGKKIALRKNI